MTEVTNDGKSPSDIDDVVDAIKAINSGVLVKDPTGTSTYLSSDGTSSNKLCDYVCKQCDNGGGFEVSTLFEGKRNLVRYTKDGIDVLAAFEDTDASDADSYWSLGACTSLTCTGTGDCLIDEHTLIIPTP